MISDCFSFCLCSYFNRWKFMFEDKTIIYCFFLPKKDFFWSWYIFSMKHMKISNRSALITYIWISMFYIRWKYFQKSNQPQNHKWMIILFYAKIFAQNGYFNWHRKKYLRIHRCFNQKIPFHSLSYLQNSWLIKFLGSLILQTKCML